MASVPPAARPVRGRAATRLVAREPEPAFAALAGPFVVDASVSAAWFLPDEATEFTRAALQATIAADVWVPTLWLPEMASLLHGAQRRRRITVAQRIELAAAASALRLQVCREPVSLQTLDALAAEYAVSAYDACKLELALRRQLALATLDDALLKAMVKAGVPRAEP